ncbi:MAG: hypothetical protein ED555_11590 [Allomuricauda sp.]|nr:MAG: hypothetical protein ED555_11590 [Allomuricauda sp.]
MTRLDQFEKSLTDFAYCELKSNEAVNLKQKFQDFKTDLNGKIFNEPTKMNGSAVGKKPVQAPLFPKRVFHNALQNLEFLKTLKKNEVPNHQEEIFNSLEINTLILLELSMRILKEQHNNAI